MHKRYLYFFVFVTGAAISAIEISASRLLAPFFGNSMFVWAIIITIILIGLALGYWWGGKVADKFPRTEGIFKIALLAGVLTSFIPLITKLLYNSFSKSILQTPISVTILTFLGSCFLFLPAITLFGFMSPYVTRVLVKDVKKTGNIAGNVYAVSTIGSVIGILTSTFWGIPFLGTKETILIFSILIIIFSIIGLRKFWLMILLIIPLIVYFYNYNKTFDGKQILYQGDTLYQYVQVVKDGSKKYLIFNEGSALQSVFDFDKNLSGYYYDYFIFAPDLIDKKNQDIAIIGFAGGVIAKEMNLYNTDYVLKIDGVEIDPKVAQIARDYFDTKDKNINIVVADGRQFINNINKKYDLVVIDAYTKEIYIPFHLTTFEFFDTLKSKLKKDAIIAANINAYSEDSLILKSILKTMAEQFENIYLVKVPDTSNFLVFASENKIDFEKISKKNIDNNQYLNVVANNIKYNYKKVDTKNYQQQLLTDNKAPLEYLTDKLIFEAVKF